MNPATQPDEFILVDRARNPEQEKVLESIRESGECPFCPENFRKEHDRPIIIQDEFWIITFNKWPYENTKFHFLFIYNQHATNFKEINPLAGIKLFEHVQWIEKEFEIISGAFFMRFGDPRYNGASVNHLHAQLLVPDIGENKDWDKIKVKLGTNPK